MRSVEEFRNALLASGLTSAAELESALADLSPETVPNDVRAFATRLIEKQVVNEFQTARILAADPTPLVVGDYALLGLLGAGGMGQVYKASHRVMERVVAIKLLPAALTKDADSIRRFRQEVRAAARLAHPNIVHAYDAGEERGVWYLVMEYVEGSDLAALVRRRGPLSVAAAVDYTLQAARGLAYAHAEGVIHRDIKPANLLLDKHGVVKILDMGLARIEATKNARDHQLTSTGDVMGTVDFMPPEQAANTRSADARSDIYSLGCTLYRLLTNSSVYAGDTVVEKLMAHMNAPIPTLRSKRSDAPVELERIFTKCLAKDPAHRFQTMTEVVAALEALAAKGLPTAPIDAGESPETIQLPTRTRGETGVDTTAWHRPDVATSNLPVAMNSDQTSATTAVPTLKLKPNGAGVGKRHRPTMRIALGAAGAAALLVFGIWMSIRSKDGREVARIEVPEGGSAVVETANPTATPTGFGPIGPRASTTRPYGSIPRTAGGSGTKPKVGPTSTRTASRPGRRSIPLAAAPLRIAISDDGRYIATTTSNVVSWLNSTTGATIWEHPVVGNVGAIDISHDGKKIAVGVQRMGVSGSTHTCLLLDTSDGKELASKLVGSVLATDCKFAPDDQTLAIADSVGKIVYRLAATDLAEVGVLTDLLGGPFSLVYSPNGDRLYVAVTEMGKPPSPPSTYFKSWDLKSGATTKLNYNGKFAFRNVEVSQDGRHLLGGVSGSGLEIIDVATGRVAVVEGTTVSVPPVAALNKRNAAALAGDSLVLIDPDDGRIIRDLGEMPQPAMALAVSADDRFAVTTSGRNLEVLVWDLDPEAASPESVTNTTAPGGASPTPAGRQALGSRTIRLGFSAGAIAAVRDGVAIGTGSRLALYSLLDDQLQWSVSIPGISVSIAASPDGSRLAVICAEATAQTARCVILNRADGALQRTLPLPAKSYAAKFSHDGRRLAIGLTTGNILLYEAVGLTTVRTLEGGLTAIGAIAFSPDDSRIAAGYLPPTGSAARSMDVWDVAGGATVTLPPEVDPQGCRSIEFSRDGTRIILALKRFGIQVRDAADGRIIGSFSGTIEPTLASHPATLAAMHLQDRIVGGAKEIVVVDPVTQRFERSLGAKAGLMRALAVTPDDRFVCVVGSDNQFELLVLDLTGNSKIADPPPPPTFVTTPTAVSSATIPRPVPSGPRSLPPVQGRKSFSRLTAPARMALGPDPKYAAFCTKTEVQWCELATGKFVWTKTLDMPTPQLALSPDGSKLYVAVAGATAGSTSIAALSTVDGVVLTTREIAAPAPTCFACGRTGTLAVGYDDGMIRCFDGNTLQTSREWAAHRYALVSLAFSPDGRSLASSAVGSAAAGSAEAREPRADVPSKATLRMWNPESGTSLEFGSEAKLASSPISFSSDGKFLLAYELNAGLQVWDVAKKEVLHSFKRTDTIPQLAPARMFAGDSLIFTGGNTFAVTEYPDGRVRKTVGGDGALRVTDIALTADGRQFVTIEQSRANYYLWDVEALTGKPPTAKAPFTAEEAPRHQAAWRDYLNLPLTIKHAAGGEMALIPPGEFLMGSTDEQIEAALKGDIRAESIRRAIAAEEKPQHAVSIPQPYLIGRTEVTVGQFKKFVDATRHITQFERASSTGIHRSWREPGYSVADDFPATLVGRDDAIAFCNWLSAEEKLPLCYVAEGNSWRPIAGSGYRLPTEAEWEFACRAGSATQWFFGDDETKLDTFAWLNNQSSWSVPEAVGRKAPNPFGLYDLYGSVAESTQGPVKFPSTATGRAIDEPLACFDAKLTALRGGGRGATAPLCRSARRQIMSVDAINGDTGFRVVRGFDKRIESPSEPVSNEQAR